MMRIVRVPPHETADARTQHVRQPGPQVFTSPAEGLPSMASSAPYELCMGADIDPLCHVCASVTRCDRHAKGRAVDASAPI